MNKKRQILFVQGGGPHVHDEWDAVLVEGLREKLGDGYEINYPRMPIENEPSYRSWKPALERILETLGDGAIVVGHSVGGTILIKVLEELQLGQKFGAIILIAPPFVGDGGWPSDELQFPHDLGTRLPQEVPIHFYCGLEDKTVPPSHVELYARVIPQARVHRLRGRDHQLNNNLTEIAAAILSLDSST